MRHYDYYESGPPETLFEYWDSEQQAELERESVGYISDSNYIKWVQRSLNRRYNVNLAIDGKKSPLYENLVRKLNEDYLGRVDDKRVDEQTQNQLIYINMDNGDYVAWLSKVINKVGYGPVTATKTLNPPLIAAIKKFQGSQDPKIKVDGNVGAKTELALIAASGIYPPGKPKSKIKPKPKTDWPAFLNTRLKDSLEYYGEKAIGPNATIVCVMKKLLHPRCNDFWIDPAETRAYYDFERTSLPIRSLRSDIIADLKKGHGRGSIQKFIRYFEVIVFQNILNGLTVTHCGHTTKVTDCPCGFEPTTWTGRCRTLKLEARRLAKDKRSIYSCTALHDRAYGKALYS